MADYYETLAADYDWIFDDDVLARGLAINNPATARLLERTSHASVVLDAACGTGINAAALARRGYRVWAANGSEAMIAVAAARFRSEQREIPLVHCMWADLPAVVGQRFDVVLCIRPASFDPASTPWASNRSPNRATCHGSSSGLMASSAWSQVGRTSPVAGSR